MWNMWGVGWWNRIYFLDDKAVSILIRVDFIQLFDCLLCSLNNLVVSRQQPPDTSWLLIVLLWTATKNDIQSLMYVSLFNRGQVDCIEQMFLSRYLFLFNYLYCTIIQCFCIVLYNIDKNMYYRHLCQIVVQF